MVTFSPEITPSVYDRSDGEEYGKITIEEYGEWELDVEEARSRRGIELLRGDVVRLSGFMGDFYVGDGHIHADKTLYETTRMAVLREVAYSELVSLKDVGVVKGLEVVNERSVQGIRG